MPTLLSKPFLPGERPKRLSAPKNYARTQFNMLLRPCRFFNECNATFDPEIESLEGSKFTFALGTEKYHLPMVVDSGSVVNFLYAPLYEKIKHHLGKHNFVSKAESRTCANNTCIRFKGHFYLPIATNSKKVTAKFFVVDGDSHALPMLSANTAKALNIFSWNPHESVDYSNLSDEHAINKVFGDFPSELHALIEKINAKYPKVFSDKLGRYNGPPAEIHVDDSSFSQLLVPPRTVPFHMYDDVCDELRGLVRDNRLEPIPQNALIKAISPLHIVRKPDGGLRCTWDMSVINRYVLRERYTPAWKFEQFNDRIGKWKYRGRLDLRSMFTQFPISEESKKYFAVSTPIGNFFATILPQGNKSSPDIAANIMSEVLKDIPEANHFAYCDDLIWGSEDPEEFLAVYENILKCLQRANLTVNKKKLEVGKEITFYGRLYTETGVRPCPSKVRALKTCEVPKSKKALTSFLAILQWHLANFTPHFSLKVARLREATRKKHFEWTDELLSDFESLRAKLVEDAELAYFVPGRKLCLQTDAAMKSFNGGKGALAAVLLMYDENDKNPKPIHYVSRVLTDPETRLAQTELEFRAVRFGCQRLRYYLEAAPKFTIATDCVALTYMFGEKKRRRERPPRIERESIYVQDLDFEIVYIKAALNGSDFLSRANKDDSKDVRDSILSQETENYVSDEMHQRHSVLNTVINYTEKRNAVRESIDGALKLLREKTDSCDDLSFLKHCIVNNDFAHNAKDKRIAPYFQVRDQLSVIDGLVYRGTRLILPVTQRRAFIEKVHNFAHQGKNKLVSLIRKSHWFPKLDMLSEDIVRRCDTCQRAKLDTRRDPQLAQPVPFSCFYTVTADFKTLPNGRKLHCIVDKLSKYPDVVECNTENAANAIKHIKAFCSHVGDVVEIQTDNSTAYNNEEFKKFLIDAGIDWLPGAPKNPQAQVDAERKNRDIQDIINKVQVEGRRDYFNAIQDHLKLYRQTPHSTTGVAPGDLVYNHPMRLGFIDFRPAKLRFKNKVNLPETMQKYIDSKKLSQERYNSKANVRHHTFRKGDFVLVCLDGVKYDSEIFRVIDMGRRAIIAEGDVSGRIVHRVAELFKHYHLPAGELTRRAREARVQDYVEDLQSDMDDFMPQQPMGGGGGGVQPPNAPIPMPALVPQAPVLPPANAQLDDGRDLQRNRQMRRPQQPDEERPVTRSRGPAAELPNVMRVPLERSAQARAEAARALGEQRREIQRREQAIAREDRRAAQRDLQRAQRLEALAERRGQLYQDAAQAGNGAEPNFYPGGPHDNIPNIPDSPNQLPFQPNENLIPDQDATMNENDNGGETDESLNEQLSQLDIDEVVEDDMEFD